jgi:inorganic pyrophosphatase
MLRSKKNLMIWALAILVCGCAQYQEPLPDTIASSQSQSDPYTLVGQKNFLAGFEPTNPDGSINVVVEIPTASIAKWEVSKPEGHLSWEIREGKPRVVNYLGYPGNYGMIPRTLLPKEGGGDGDPLDVIALGPAVPRGSVITVKLVGVLKLLDTGEQDDKLIAVMADTPLYTVNNMSDLYRYFPGTTTIVETWFANYKGVGKMVSLGFGEASDALDILNSAITAYAQEQATH